MTAALFKRLFAIRGRSQSVAARGERAAKRYLSKKGYRILARNLRNRFGEIDLLVEAPDRRTIVIVEVKAAAHRIETLPPEAHVTAAKQRKLTALAVQIARRYRLTDRPLRFDVIAVDFDTPNNPTLRHHQGAFESHV